MKKVLILAYDFPPYVSVGGLRPYAWYRYFKESGIYPVVVTRQWSNKHGSHLDYVAASEFSETQIEETEFGTIVRAAYRPNMSNRLLLRFGESRFKIIRTIITAFYEFGQFLFMIGPKSSVYFAAEKYLKSNDVDLIIATGDPFVLFKYASVLSRNHNISWIADYRDPWTQDRNKSKNRLLAKWNAFFEKKYVDTADEITTVSSFLNQQIGQIIKNKPINIIPNGYDPQSIESAKRIDQNHENFSISYVGTIYKWHPLESFLSVCSDFVDKQQKPDFQINFYGVNAETEIKNLAHSKFKNLLNHICIYPKMQNIQLLEKLASNNIMLLFNYYSYMGTKIFDYLALNRKILLCYSHDIEAIELKDKYYNIDDRSNPNRNLQEDLINETNSGIVVKDAEHLSRVLADLYSEFKLKGFIECNSTNTEQFSRKNQIQKLAEIFHRVTNSKKLTYQQCTRCVMDTSDPDIRFDEKGCCNHCSGYFENISKNVYQGKSSDLKLAKLVEKIQKSGLKNEHDCVIGISGGVDSIYTAYLAKKLGLRILAVHMDNGWNSELAVSNIEKVLKKLDINLYTTVLDWEEFRDLQLAFLKASVPEAETPTDIAIPAALHKVAANYNIKYILSGGNFATEGILPKSWHYDAKDVKYLKAIHRKFGTKKLRTFPTFGYAKEIYYKFFRGIRMIYPLNFIPYNKKDAIKILEQELDWKNYGGKHHESIYTKFIQSYLLPEKFGIDYRRATFSTQICAGDITREEALSELTKRPFNPEKIQEEKEYVSKKLCITKEELDKIIHQSPKSYKDYPNDKKKLEFIYDVYRKLNR